ncbi:hypothetical protein SAY87_021625 [Trapa incisa]|uniref:F-box domain-containing protein n=1 Tax=Trapa incisa TaxID=236973 RepID=A0AAN7JTI1_9MYRT|nr:hypothetical protein SAY87_021625 [Trapa incisa]
MDELLCDELLQEIFTRLPLPSSRAVTLVSRRWLSLYRSSRSSLSLRLPAASASSLISSVTSLLSHHPSLSSLSLLLSNYPTYSHHGPGYLPDRLLSAVASHCSGKLAHLRFLAGPLRNLSLLSSLSVKFTNLTSLTVSLSRPLLFVWVLRFPSLKELSISVTSSDGIVSNFPQNGPPDNRDCQAELGLESLSVSGIRGDDWGVCWLWRNCRKLKRLLLKSCEGIGDDASYSSFVQCLRGLEEVQLRTCRSIVDGVLLQLAENCKLLRSLLVYDGGSRDGLLQFITACRCNLQSLDLRLPLDFKNDHLRALSLDFRSISSLRLQSCCLVTGDGLKIFGIAMSNSLRELALINCDVVEREPGLLATLGQHFRQLKKLDLSYNEMLPDKEVISMLASCSFLVDLRLRGCKGLGNLTLASIPRSCRLLECVDIVHCCSVDAKAVESLIVNSPRLKQVQVEEAKVSDAARTCAALKFMSFLPDP